MTGRKIWLETAMGSAAGAAQALVPLLTLPVLARELGAHTWGTLSAGLAWAAFFAAIFGLSINQVILRELTVRGKEALPRLIGTTVILYAALVFLAFFAGFLLWWSSKGQAFGGIPIQTVGSCLLTIPFLMWTPLGLGLFQAVGQVNRFYGLSLAAAGVTITLTWLLVGIFSWGIGGAITSLVIGGMVLQISSMAMLSRAVRFRIQGDRELTGSLLRQAAVLHWAALGYQLVASGDLLVLNFFRPPQEVAWYRFSMIIVSGVMLVPAAMASSFFSLGARLGAWESWKMQKRLMLQLAPMLIGLLVVLELSAGTVTRLMGGPDFGPATNIMRVLLLSVLGMAPSALLASQWVLRGMLRETAILTAFHGVIVIVLTVWLVPQWGALAAATVRVAGFLLVLVINAAVAIRVFERPPTSTGERA